jgi:hypothetical protein
LLGFVGFLAAAMAVYPGGTWSDRSVSGHHFFANFLCDLTQPSSLSGVNNSRGAALAQIGLLLFGLALAGFFAMLPAHFRVGARAGRWVRGLGVSAVLCFVAVPLTPSEHFGRAHAALALTAGSLGIAAGLCALAGLIAAQRRALVALGALSLASGMLEAVLFIYHLGDPAPPLLVPAVQKVAAALLSAWMAAVAAATLLEAPGSRHATRAPSGSNPPPPVP